MVVVEVTRDISVFVDTNGTMYRYAILKFDADDRKIPGQLPAGEIYIQC